MSEMGWRSQSFDTSEWLTDYATRRYGGQSSSANKAWQLFHQSCYNSPWDWSLKSLINRVPNRKMEIYQYQNVSLFVEVLYDPRKK
jgi:hypothetical protein